MSIERTLFAAADRMWGTMKPGEYRHVALGMIFPRRVSESFQRLHDRLADALVSDGEDRDEYLAKHLLDAGEGVPVLYGAELERPGDGRYA